LWIQIDTGPLFESLDKFHRERIKSVDLCPRAFRAELKTEGIVWFGNRKGDSQF
jgi:hypothetical protein